MNYHPRRSSFYSYSYSNILSSLIFPHELLYSSFLFMLSLLCVSWNLRELTVPEAVNLVTIEVISLWTLEVRKWNLRRIRVRTPVSPIPPRMRRQFYKSSSTVLIWWLESLLGCVIISGWLMQVKSCWQRWEEGFSRVQLLTLKSWKQF